MSDTPRTDAKESETEDGGMERHAYYGWKFARTLERELAEKDREIEMMRPVVDLAIAAKSQGLLPMYLDIAVGDYEKSKP